LWSVKPTPNYSETLISAGIDTFTLWRKIVENVFCKEDLSDLLDPNNSDDSNSETHVVDVEPA
jgi:hypothetical protein